MKLWSWITGPTVRLDVVAGIVDGVLTALTLTAAKMLQPAGSLGLGLAFRIGAAAGLTTVFVFFLAHYAQLRTSLIHAEQQLNVLRHGRLAESDLGRKALGEAVARATLAGTCSVLGALLPMLIIVILPGPPWLGCAITILILGGLGALLAKSFHGSRLGWAAMLMTGGAALTLLGAELRIAG